MIWFYLQDMGFSHCPCYWLLGRTNWASFLGRHQGPERFTGLAFSLGFGEWAFTLISKPYQLPPSLCIRMACARAVSFLESDATSICLLRAGLVKVNRCHMSCDNDDLSIFEPISSSSYGFF